MRVSGKVEDVLVGMGNRRGFGDGIIRDLMHTCMGGVGVSLSQWVYIIPYGGADQ